MRTKTLRPYQGSLNATSYPGACAPGYYLSAPTGLCRKGSDGILRQVLNSIRPFNRETSLSWRSSGVKSQARDNGILELMGGGNSVRIKQEMAGGKKHETRIGTDRICEQGFHCRGGAA